MLHTPEAKELPTFATFVDDEWLPVYPAKAGNKQTTIREVTSHLKIHLKPFFGSTRLDKIDARTLDKFVAHMSKKMIGKPAATRTSRNGTLAAPRPMKPKRIKNVLGTLHSVLMTAHEWGTLAALPKFPKVKASLPDFDFYNSTEVHQLLAAARDAEDRAILMFACYTGARAGEQLALEWTAVDTRSKIVSFSRSRTRGVTTEGTKSGKPRKVPMRESLLAALAAIKHLKGPLVFCQADGAPLALWILHDHLGCAARRAQLRLLRWHDLRHSFASNLTIGGTPMRQVQEWMGHSTILMTMRYSHLAPGGEREFLAALDAPVPAKKDVAAEYSSGVPSEYEDGRRAGDRRALGSLLAGRTLGHANSDGVAARRDCPFGTPRRALTVRPEHPQPPKDVRYSADVPSTCVVRVLLHGDMRREGAFHLIPSHPPTSR